MQLKIPFLISVIGASLFFQNCAFSQKETALEEALSWAYDDKYFGFDNWEQLKGDFGFDTTTLWGKKWIPKLYDKYGNENPEEKKKDNFTFYSGNFFGIEYFKSLGKKIGIAYPDLKWEAKNGHSPLNIFKVSSGFKKDSLFNLLKRENYRQYNYKGKKIFCYNCVDSKQEFKEPTLALMNAVCFVETENILLISNSEEVIKKSIDAHDNKTSLIYKPGIKDLIEGTKNAESVFVCDDAEVYKDPITYGQVRRIPEETMKNIIKDLPSKLGLTQKEFEELHPPKMFCLGEKKNGLAFCNVAFENKDFAKQDAQSRLKILSSGRSIVTQAKLSDYYFLPEVKTNGKVLLFSWSVLPSSTDVGQALWRYDLPWLISLEKKK